MTGRSQSLGLLVLASALTSSACRLFAPETPSGENHPPAGPSEAMPPVPSASSALPEESPAASAAPSAAPAAVEPGVVQGGGPTRGTLPKRALNAGLAQGTPAFEGCYSRELAKHAGLRGTILMSFVIAPDGSVPYAAALDQGTDLANERVIHCVLDALQKLSFEPPRGGRAVITYPLHFEPGEEATKPDAPEQ